MEGTDQSAASAAGAAENRKAGIHVIVLGPTGGPREDMVTGLLVRSSATKWALNSIVAVDAGILLAGIVSSMTDCDKDEKGVLTSGPFAGLHLPHESIPANAAYVFQKVIGAVLVTHPHLDHVSALAMNTPILGAGSGPKTVAALPSVVTAIKNHLFNDVIWPNLSDEDGGVGLITYHRLADGGNLIMGRGDERGYVRACDGLLARCFSISHGRRKQLSYRSEPEIFPSIFQRASSAALSLDRPRLSVDMTESGAFSDSLRSSASARESWYAVDSSAFFIRDQHSNTEIIVFGDVEPDSLSLNPRNKRIWDVAAPKVVSRQLRAIFIECSYSDSTDDEFLFGHLCPRHLVEELSVLARLVNEAKGMDVPASGKRKRGGNDAPPSTEPLSPRTKRSSVTTSKSKPTPYQVPRNTRLASKLNTEQSTESSDGPGAVTNPVDPQALRRELTIVKDSNPPQNQPPVEMPLAGLSIYIIHVKDEMTDGPLPCEKILKELNDHGQKAGLGCEFHIPKRGESIYF